MWSLLCQGVLDLIKDFLLIENIISSVHKWYKSVENPIIIEKQLSVSVLNEVSHGFNGKP